MWKIFLVLTVGFFIGFHKLIRGKLIQLNSRMQILWLLLLIFCMGVSIGRNGAVLESLPSLGGKALLFSVLAVAGSILFVFVLSKLFLEKGEKK